MKYTLIARCGNKALVEGVPVVGVGRQKGNKKNLDGIRGGVVDKWMRGNKNKEGKGKERKEHQQGGGV